MTYLYAGLGVALLVPLMALVQTLINVAQLDREGNDLALLQNQKQVIVAQEFRTALNQAINANRLVATAVDQKGDKIGDRVNPACAELPNVADPQKWIGTYPNCSDVVAATTATGAARYLRVNLKITQDTGNIRRDLPVDPLTQAVDVKTSCWVPGLTQECS
jgi:hypothetical protein